MVFVNTKNHQRDFFKRNSVVLTKENLKLHLIFVQSAVFFSAIYEFYSEKFIKSELKYALKSKSFSDVLVILSIMHN